MPAPSLDRSVADALDSLDARSVPAPRALLLLGTGSGLLPGRLQSPGNLLLHELAGVPPAWRGGQLHHGRLNGLPVWMIPDDADAAAPREAPWHAAFPCWLAAAAGARAMVHTSAGASLPVDEPPPLGSIALVSDHLNLSGSSPLIGLGESRLGPLFPDTGRAHDLRLRAHFLGQAGQQGLHAVEAIAACTSGPALDTPAERRFFALAGAQVAVQGLAEPVLAAVHAGLTLCALVAVTDDGHQPCDLARIAAVAERLAPALEELLFCAAPGLSRQVEREAEAPPR